MKILVATSRYQGSQAGDFFLAEEGEMVRVPVYGTHAPTPITAPDRGYPALIGVDSGKGTTTVAVADLEISEVELLHRLQMSYLDSGWAIDLAHYKAVETLALFNGVAQKLEAGLVLNTQAKLLSQVA